MRALRLLASVLALVGCAPDEPPPPAAAISSAPVVTIPGERWRAVLVAGDNSSPAFDNGIEALRQRFGGMGVRNISTYSARGSRPGAQLSTARNIGGGLARAGGEACLVYMTSHGEEGGLFLKPDGRLLSPAALEQALTAGCGDRPTVLVVSACHSGTFINAQTRRPNRIIFAAAATDRTSFGCGADDEFTYYDQCFLQQLDGASTWRELGQATRSCVETLERRLGVRRESRPQLFVGSTVANLRLPGR